MLLDTLIAIAVVFIGAGVVALLVHKSRTKEERHRAKAIADANGRRHDPLTEEEQRHADAIHEIVQEARTGELPKYRDPTRPTFRDTVRRYRRSGKHSAKRPAPPGSKPVKSVKTALTGPLPAELAPAVMLPGVIPHIDIDTFTGEWAAGSRYVRKVGAPR